jgi:exo-1,4-beta-D-glucosaminidase
MPLMNLLEPLSRVLVVTTLVLGLVAPAAAQQRTDLRAGWVIQSSCQVAEKGSQISTPAFVPKGWHSTTVPSTVLAALVADRVFADPFVGMSLRSIPGTSYPIGRLFSRLPMPEDSPYKCSWWYRTEFRASGTRGRITHLHFGGINYRANVWLNGRQIANATDIAGAYRTYEFDVTQALRAGAANVLAVEVFAPTEKDLAINWVDWNPTPADKNLGLWREVYLTDSGPVVMRNPQVTSVVDVRTLESAELTVTAQIQNATDQSIAARVEGRIEAIRVKRDVTLAPRETRVVSFTPQESPELKLARPRLWWPYQMGSPNLYTAELSVLVGGAVSDRQDVRFGIREVTSELTEQGHRVFRVNGRRILIRGAGWAPDMFLRESRARTEAELRYVKDMHLNAIRLEGKLETDSFYSLADEMGLLIMPGWCCCDIWEQWKNWPPENQGVATESLKSQVLRMRNHPSIFVWLNGSDNPPPAAIEQAYLDVLKQYGWPNPAVSSATQQRTALTGASGVKMTGPYDWVPPSYWMTDTKNGGAFGFNTETGPGPAVPPAESLRKFIPADHLWPIDDVWNFHAGGGGFRSLDVFRAAMDARYGQPAGMEDFARWSQVMAYEGERAMFEAYSRNKYVSTGVIQWMLNNAWPSLIWHLYDYYLMPAGGYFGTKKACEPVHALYSYDDRSVWVVNSTYARVSGLKLSVRVFNLDLAEQHATDAAVDVEADGSRRVLVIPDVAGLTPTYFVRLDLRDASGHVVSTNFYWLSTKPDVYDWAKTDYKFTPVTGHGDFTALKALPAADVEMTSRLERERDRQVVRVHVKNVGKSLAFMVRLRLVNDRTHDDILPIFWDDNFFPLMPGEEREIVGSCRLGDVPGTVTPVVLIEGANVVARSPKRSE